MADVAAIEPACIGIEVQQGTDNTFDFILTDGDGKAVDITADDVTLTIRDDYGGAVQNQQTSGAGAHLDGEAGRVQFTVPRADIDDEASATSETHWVYEVRRLIGVTGDQAVHIAGEFKILPSVGV